MPVPIPLVMGGMIIASERIRPAWREPVRRPLPVPDRSSVLGQGGVPGARAEPATLMGGRSGGESMDPQPAPTCRHGRKTGAPEA